MGTSFGLEHRGEHLGVVEMPIPGLHNARNATAALVAAQLVGAPFAAAQAALAHYAGVARRYQFRGTVDGITLVDDYAHNPGKVAAVVGTAALGGWGRVVAVFQPHRYSRTEDLGAEFADSFRGADRVVVMAIDGAGEAPRPGHHGPAGGRRRAAGPPGPGHQPSCPTGRAWSTSWPRSSATGTSASPWAPATSPASPTRCWPASPGEVSG